MGEGKWGKGCWQGWQGLKAREDNGKWEVGRVDRKEGRWQGVDGTGRGETGRGNLEECNGEGEIGREAIETGRGWQWGGGQSEEEMERGNGEGGEMGRGQWGGGKGKGWGGAEEGARGGEISQMHMMGCLGGHRL